MTSPKMIKVETGENGLPIAPITFRCPILKRLTSPREIVPFSSPGGNHVSEESCLGCHLPVPRHLIINLVKIDHVTWAGITRCERTDIRPLYDPLDIT